MSKPAQSRYWTPEEHARFLDALVRYGPKDVKAISSFVGTRNPTQVRTHAQKFYLRLGREAHRSREKVEADRTGRRSSDGAYSDSPETEIRRNKNDEASLMGAEYMPKDWTAAHYQQFRAVLEDQPIEGDVSKRCAELSRSTFPQFTPEELELIYYKVYLEDIRARSRPSTGSAPMPNFTPLGNGTVGIAGALPLAVAASMAAQPFPDARQSPLLQSGLVPAPPPPPPGHLTGTRRSARPAVSVPNADARDAASALTALSQSPPPAAAVAMSKRPRVADEAKTGGLGLYGGPVSPGTMLAMTPTNTMLPLPYSPLAPLTLSPLASPGSQAFFGNILEHAMLPNRDVPIVPSASPASMPASATSPGSATGASDLGGGTAPAAGAPATPMGHAPLLGKMQPLGGAGAGTMSGSSGPPPMGLSALSASSGVPASGSLPDDFFAPQGAAVDRAASM